MTPSRMLTTFVLVLLLAALFTNPQFPRKKPSEHQTSSMENSRVILKLAKKLRKRLALPRIKLTGQLRWPVLES